MAARKSTSATMKLPWVARHPRRFLVYALLAISLGANIFLASTFYYITHNDPMVLSRLAVNQNCSPAHYTKWMQSINDSKFSDPEKVKKFAAASLCFTDYQTGRPLDLNSFKPNMNQSPQLPAHP